MASDTVVLNEDADWLHPTLIARLRLLSAAVLSILLFDWIARTISIPDAPGFSASLLQQPDWFVSLLMVAICTVAVMVAAGLLIRWPRPDAPVLCTAAGMAVLSWRGGPMQYALFVASGPYVFIKLAVETVLLFAVLVGAWLLLQAILRRIKTAPVRNGPDEAEPETFDEKILGTFAHAALMTTLMLLLSRTDAKTQSLASVGVSSCFAAVGAYQIVRVRSSFWFWIAPLAVALLGYIFASFNAEGWQNGVLHGAIAALARPLPLDYVSMGPVGAIIGYAMAGGGKVSYAGDDTLEPTIGDAAIIPE